MIRLDLFLLNTRARQSVNGTLTLKDLYRKYELRGYARNDVGHVWGISEHECGHQRRFTNKSTLRD